MTGHPWPTFWDRVPLDRRTALTTRGAHIFGHIAGPGPIHGRPVSLGQFLTAGLRRNAAGRVVHTGVLTAAGRPAAEVIAWRDQFGIACSGRLLRPSAITACARLDGADPWPQWHIVGDAAHLVAVELDRSRPESPTRTELARPAREAALQQRLTARRKAALGRIERARRR